MNKPSLQRRIVGRVRNYMTAIFMTIATIFIPLGIYMIVETSMPDWAGQLTSSVGFLFLIFANFSAVHDKREELDENRNQAQQLKDLINELRQDREIQKNTVNTLINEIRQERNERNNKERKIHGVISRNSKPKL